MKIKTTLEVIASEAAVELATVALEEGKKLGVAISVVVSDPNMTEIVFIKADGATPHSALTSRRKSQTAASTKRPTGWMSSELAVTLPLASGNLLTNVGGGFPVKMDGTIIGAIGVAGGTVDQDKQIAVAALKKIGADITE